MLPEELIDSGRLLRKTPMTKGRAASAEEEAAALRAGLVDEDAYDERLRNGVDQDAEPDHDGRMGTSGPRGVVRVLDLVLVLRRRLGGV